MALPNRPASTCFKPPAKGGQRNAAGVCRPAHTESREERVGGGVGIEQGSERGAGPGNRNAEENRVQRSASRGRDNPGGARGEHISISVIFRPHQGGLGPQESRRGWREPGLHASFADGRRGRAQVHTAVSQMAGQGTQDPQDPPKPAVPATAPAVPHRHCLRRGLRSGSAQSALPAARPRHCWGLTKRWQETKKWQNSGASGAGQGQGERPRTR